MMRQPWDDVKEYIREYYKTQNKSLAELEQLMISKHDFHKSRRSYMNKIVEWGFEKNKRHRTRSSQSIQGRKRPNIHASGSHTANAMNSVSQLSHSVVPALSPLWTHGQSSWPVTEFMESPPSTLDNPYANYPSLQISPPSSTIGTIAHQSLQAGETVEGTRYIHGQTPLHHAALEGDLERVQALLSRDHSLHEIDDYGNQPLHYAAEKFCTGIIDLLLKNGANVNARGAGGRTPLHLALRSAKAVNRLLREHPTRTAHDDEGNSVLHTALDVFSTTSNDAGMVRTIKKLVLSGYDVNTCNRAGRTPFHMACGSRNKAIRDILVLFLDNQAKTAFPDPNNKMPFQIFLDGMHEPWYSIGDEIKLVQLFLHCGADPNTFWRDSPLLLTALIEIPSYSGLLESLCETADIDKLAANGDSPLHIIARDFITGDTALCNILLRRGASPNQINKSGNSPLMLLSMDEHDYSLTIGMMASLIQAGANPMQRHRDGELPVYHAYRSLNSGTDKRREVLKVLVESYIANDTVMEESRVYPNDHIWWVEYRLLRRRKTCCGEGLRRLAACAHYLPHDIAKDFSDLLLIEAAHDILTDFKERFLTHKAGFGLETIAGREFHDVIVEVLRECLRMKLKIEHTWYQLLLEFFD